MHFIQHGAVLCSKDKIGRPVSTQISDLVPSFMTGNQCGHHLTQKFPGPVNSRRFPGGFLNSRRFPGVVDTLSNQSQNPEYKTGYDNKPRHSVKVLISWVAWCSYSTCELLEADVPPVAVLPLEAVPDAVDCVVLELSGGFAAASGAPVALSMASESLSCWRYKQHPSNIQWAVKITQPTSWWSVTDTPTLLLCDVATFVFRKIIYSSP